MYPDTRWRQDIISDLKVPALVLDPLLNGAWNGFICRTVHTNTVIVQAALSAQSARYLQLIFDVKWYQQDTNYAVNITGEKFCVTEKVTVNRLYRQ